MRELEAQPRASAYSAAGAAASRLSPNVRNAEYHGENKERGHSTDNLVLIFSPDFAGTDQNKEKGFRTRPLRLSKTRGGFSQPQGGRWDLAKGGQE